MTKLFGFEQKSQIKSNYPDFLLVNAKYWKTCKNFSGYTKITIIQHYLTFLDLKSYLFNYQNESADQLWPNLVPIYQNECQNLWNNFMQLNNGPSLV